MAARFTILAALLMPCALSAQTIRGVVVEYGTSNTIAGASIEVVGRTGSMVVATSDSLGRFVVYPASAGRATVRATHPSYLAERTDTVTANSRETVTLIVRMTRQAIAIAPIVVTARSSSVYGGFYERQRRNAFGTYIDEKVIARKNPVSVAHLMRDVHGIEVADYYGSKHLTFRGRMASALPAPSEDAPPPVERCNALIFVDGMPVAGGQDFDLEHVVPLSRIAAVEVYPDATAVPFEFTSIGNDCGAVAFWTHPVRDERTLTWKRVGIATLLLGAVIVIEALFLRRGTTDISDRSVRDFTWLPDFLRQPPSIETPGRLRWAVPRG